MSENQTQNVKALATEGSVKRSKILAWAMWDWATQPWYTVITTFVFAVYITKPEFGNTNYTTTMLTVSTSISGLLIGLLAPALGQRADLKGTTVSNMRILTVILAIISALMFFVEKRPDFLGLGLGLLGVGSIVAEVATVDYNSTITQVASQKNIGKVSGFGWGLGYMGGIIMLLTLYFLLIKPDVNTFGLGHENGIDIRVSMVLCAVWTVLFAIPTFMVLKSQPGTLTKGKKASFFDAYRRLWRTLKDMWQNDRQVLRFLFASALYRDGVGAVFTFGAVIAAGTFGFSAGDVIIFGAAANIVAGIATMVFGILDDKLGSKKIIILSLIAIVVLGFGVFIFHASGATAFWIMGMALTIFVGPVQAASRSYLTKLIPAGKTGEIFGLYATTGRVATFLAPTFIGVMISVGAAITGESNTQYWGILGIAIVILVGTIAMLTVREPESKQ